MAHMGTELMVLLHDVPYCRKGGMLRFALFYEVRYGFFEENSD